MGMQFFCCNGRHEVEKHVAEQRAQIEMLHAHGIQRSPLPLLHAEEVPIPVCLNVYSLTDRNKKLVKLGIGVFHTGVVVYGIEWGYGEAMDNPNSSGLFCVVPGRAAGSLYKSIKIGHTTKTPAQVDTILHRMENEWRSNEYHILHHNCNHFAQAFCDALSNGTNKLVVPAWCNRAARLSDKILPKKLATKVQRMLDDEPPHAVPAAARPSNVADIPVSVIPRHWYLQPNIYPSSRNMTLMSYRNASMATSVDVPAPGAHAHASTPQADRTGHPPAPAAAVAANHNNSGNGGKPLAAGSAASPDVHHSHHRNHLTGAAEMHDAAASQPVPAAALGKCVPATKHTAPSAVVSAADHVAAPIPPPPLRTPRAVADEMAVPHAAPRKADNNKNNNPATSTIITSSSSGTNAIVPAGQETAKPTTAATLSPLPQALSPSPPPPPTAATPTTTTPLTTTAMSDGLGVIYSPMSGHGENEEDRLISSNASDLLAHHVTSPLRPPPAATVQQQDKKRSPAAPPTTTSSGDAPVGDLTAQLRKITEQLHEAAATSPKATPPTRPLSATELRRLSSDAVSTPRANAKESTRQPVPLTPLTADLAHTTTMTGTPAAAEEKKKEVPSRFVRAQLLAQAIPVTTVTAIAETMSTPKASPALAAAAATADAAATLPVVSSPVVHSLASSPVSSPSLRSSASSPHEHAAQPPSANQEPMSSLFVDATTGKPANSNAALAKHTTPVVSPRSPVMAQTLPRMQCASRNDDPVRANSAQCTKTLPQRQQQSQQQRALGGSTVAAALRNASPRPRLRRSASDSDMYVQRRRVRCTVAVDAALQAGSAGGLGNDEERRACLADSTTPPLQVLSQQQQQQRAQAQSARQSPHALGLTGRSVLFTHAYELHSAPSPADVAQLPSSRASQRAELVEESTGFVKPYSASDVDEEEEMRQGNGRERQGCTAKMSSGTESSTRLLLSHRPRGTAAAAASAGRQPLVQSATQRTLPSEMASPMTDRLLSSPASARIALHQTSHSDATPVISGAAGNDVVMTTPKASPRVAMLADSPPCRTSPEHHTHTHHHHPQQQQHARANGELEEEEAAMMSPSRERNEASVTVTPGVVLSLPLSPTAESVLTAPLRPSQLPSLMSDKHARKKENEEDEAMMMTTTTTTEESERSIASAP